jgi:hypothetical protein
MSQAAATGLHWNTTGSTVPIVNRTMNTDRAVSSGSKSLRDGNPTLYADEKPPPFCTIRQPKHEESNGELDKTVRCGDQDPSEIN